MITHWRNETWGPGKWPPIPKVLYVVLALWCLSFIWGMVQLGCQGLGEVESVDAVAGRDSTIITVRSTAGGSIFLLCDTALAGGIAPGQWAAFHGEPGTVDEHNLIDIDRLHRVLDLQLDRFAEISDQATRFVEDLAGNRPLAAVLGAGILLLGSFLLRLVSGLVLAAVGMALLWRLLLWLGAAGLIDLSSGLATGAFLTATGLAFVYAGLRRRHAVNRWMQSFAVAVALSLLAQGFANELDWPEPVVATVAGIGSLVSPVVGIWLLSGFFMALGMATSLAGQLVVLALVFVATHVHCRGDWFPGRKKGASLLGPHPAANERGEVPIAAVMATTRKERS